MARGISYSRTYDGYLQGTFRDKNGRVVKVKAAGSQELARLLKREVESGGRTDLRVTRTGTTAGIRGIGSRSKSARDQKIYLEESFKKIFGEIKGRAILAGSAAASAANAIISEDVAELMLKRVYSIKGNYNIYTGNLDRAYAATVVTGYKARKTLHLEGTPEGNTPVPNKRGSGMIVHLFGDPNHPPRKIKKNKYGRRSMYFHLKGDKEYNRVDYRTFKKWELEKGYRHKGYVNDRKGNLSGFQNYAIEGYNKGSGRGKNQIRVNSAVIVENTAPYAGAVQAAGYDVIPGAIMRSYSYGSKQETALLVMTREMLKAANLIK